MDERKLDRRELLKRGLSLAGVLIGGKALLSSAIALADAPAPKKKVFKLIDLEKNTTAKSLKYTHDGATNPARTLAAANCGNCQMYKTKGDLVDGVEVGTCNMIGGGYVKTTGWCTSWTKDPRKFKK